MMSISEGLQWRYATKKFDPARMLTDEQVDELLEATRLSASSFGLQPYKILVVQNTDLRGKIREAAFGQTQVTDASHLIVFCAHTDVNEAYIDHFVDIVAEERGVDAGALKTYRDMMVGAIGNMPAEGRTEWSKKQAYIALGTLLAACGEMKVDACPMEGFNPQGVDTVLGLAEKNLTSVLLCPIGHRAADDQSALYKKVRFPQEELFDYIA